MSILASMQTGNISRAVAEQTQALDPIRQFILDHFGQNGLYVAYLLAAALAALVIYKVIKLSFELLLLVILPSVIAAFVLTYVLPYSFYYLLPATAAVFTLGLVVRHVAFAKG